MIVLKSISGHINYLRLIILHCRARKFKAVDTTDFCKCKGTFPSLSHWWQQVKTHRLSPLKTELSYLPLEMPA